MRKLSRFIAVCSFICMISCASCQKPGEVTSAGDSAASGNAAVKPETNEPGSDTANAKADNKVEAANHDEAPDMTGFLAGFEPYGLSANTAKPAFANGFYTPNGDRKSLYKGKTVYMKIADSVSDEEFLKYCQGIFAEIQSKADQNTVYQYDLTNQTRGDVIQKLEQATVGKPVEMFWTKDGKNLALYANIREYQAHYLMECATPCKALYLSVNEIP